MDDSARRRYAVFRASVMKLAEQKGYTVGPIAPEKWEIIQKATGERQRNPQVLGDQSYFSLEDAKTWLSRI